MMNSKWLPGLLLCLGLLVGCDSGGEDGNSDGPANNSGPARSFQLGFTPWPFDSTITALNTTYSLIQENGDIVAHHLKQGVPWQEALTGSPYPQHLTREIDGRISRTMSGKTVYLAIDPLSTLRDTLAGNWGENGQEPRSAPWDARSFATPEVITAFTNFSLDMIERFEPAYFNYATEATELLLTNPQDFSDFVVFAREVYANIKRAYPDLPLMVSVGLKSPGSPATNGFIDQFPRIADYVDIVGISVYPYAFFQADDGRSPGALPDNWLRQIQSIAPNKPVAITETGWVGEDLDIPRFDLSVNSSENNQRNYVTKMLEAAESLDAQFVIWFTAVDFDAFWRGALGRDDLALIWRDAGLYDENLRGRPALDVWQDWLGRRYEPDA